MLLENVTGIKNAQVFTGRKGDRAGFRLDAKGLDRMPGRCPATGKQDHDRILIDRNRRQRFFWEIPARDFGGVG